MNAQDMISLIQAEIEGAQVIPEGEDCNFTVTVVSDAFESLLPIKRQQKVLNVFSEQLRVGSLHALTVKAYTQSEWEKAQADAPVLMNIQGLD